MPLKLDVELEEEKEPKVREKIPTVAKPKVTGEEKKRKREEAKRRRELEKLIKDQKSTELENTIDFLKSKIDSLSVEILEIKSKINGQNTQSILDELPTWTEIKSWLDSQDNRTTKQIESMWKWTGGVNSKWYPIIVAFLDIQNTVIKQRRRVQ